jgi:glycosyltransferase involved in cell wall biosynthesis
MRILVIVTFYYPHWTGLTTHAVRAAEGLAARGHRVTVLTTRHSPRLARDEIVHQVRVIRLEPAVTLTRTMVAPAFPFMAARLIGEHDVVQIHTPLAEALLVALLCRARGRPLVMTHHGDLVMPRGIVNQFIQRSAFVLTCCAGSLASAVTSYSADYATHSRLLRKFQDKLSCIYPPIEMPAPEPEAVAAWRAALGLTNRLLIGFAGRWVEEKGFDRLIQALPLIRRNYPHAHLIYAGEHQITYEDFYRRCQPLIEAERDHLTMLGLLRDRQQMANFYRMCDLFVLPSRTDMMGLVQAEAMLCGTPVVASDIPGARVVVRETGFGRLATPNDPQALARTVVETLRDLDQYRPDRGAVQSIFDANHSFSQYEMLMQQLLDRRAKPKGACGDILQ